MNSVTVGVLACAGSPSIAAVAPGITGAIAARYTPEDPDEDPDEDRAPRALAELDRALAEHGAPDPERTAAWLGAPCPECGAAWPECVDDAFGAALDLLGALGRGERA